MEKSVYSSYEKRKEEKESKSIPHTEIETETESNEAANVRVVREALTALNSGDISKVQEFISPQYFNHESQMDPVRSKLEDQKSSLTPSRIYEVLLLIFTMKNKRPLRQKIRLFQY